MTKDKAEKAVVRERMATTGESYTAARAQLGSAQPAPEKRTRTCSFCGKPQDQVKKLIAGPGVHICDECIDMCAEIVSVESSEEPAPADEPTAEQRQWMADRVAQASTVEARLGKLTGLARAQSQVDYYIAEAVRDLRASDVAWARIAEALNVTPQWAKDRYSDGQKQ